MERLGACEQVPVTVARIEWVNSPQRTHIPPTPLHDRWRLEIDLSTQDQPVRGAAMLLTDDLLHHTRGWADQPSATVNYQVKLSPYGQGGAEVQASINAGIQVAVASEALNKHPHEVVRPVVQIGDTLRTGTVIDLLSFAGIGWTAQVALLVTADTKNDRTRWHVRTPLAIDAPYDFLMTGQRSGAVDLTGRHDEVTP